MGRCGGKPPVLKNVADDKPADVIEKPAKQILELSLFHVCNDDSQCERLKELS
jgi:hypothetical protein